jgi:phage terminase small subunit
MKNPQLSLYPNKSGTPKDAQDSSLVHIILGVFFLIFFQNLDSGFIVQWYLVWGPVSAGVRSCFVSRPQKYKFKLQLICTVSYGICQMIMGLPAQLTERQKKFAELLVYNEGRKSAAECAYEAGYTTRPRQAASELRSPKYSPLVVKYIGELRKEVQEKHGVDFERHVSELAKLRDAARDKGAWAAAINAEVARGKAGGLYIDQKVIMTGSLDSLSEKELEAKLKQILEDHKNIINISSEDTEEISKEQLASYEESK